MEILGARAGQVPPDDATHRPPAQLAIHLDFAGAGAAD